MGLTGRRAELRDLPLFAFRQVGDGGHGQAEGLDWRAVPAGGAVCTACGRSDYPGHRTGEWQIGPDGRLYHWCSGGRPGTWQPCRLAQGEEVGK